MNWWEYLILVNVYLVLFFSFYVLLLKRETFFQLNRLYLVSAALLSFLMPLIQSSWIKSLFITQTVHATIYGSKVVAYQFTAVPDTSITIGELLGIVYLVGVGLLLLRFVWQMIALNRIIKNPDGAAPYTFFKKVNVADSLSENEIIAAHEQVHANQLHSADVMIIEAVMIINWFNPVVYCYRFAIKHVHEFIADSYTLRNGTNKADYAMLLLNQTFNTPQHQLVSNFFSKSLLKQRILMLQKNRSARVKLLKYCFSAPLFVLMLIISAATVNNSRAVTKVNQVAGRVLDMPASKITMVKLIPPENSVKTDSSARVTNLVIQSHKNDTAIITEASVTKEEVVKPDKDDTAHNEVFTAVEVEPEFPGSFGAFLAKNIRYPAADKASGTQGKVYIQFVVEADGSLSDIKAIRSTTQGMADEAVRVLSLSPKWKPGVQNGRKVRVMYTVPIAFTLSDVKPEPQKQNDYEPITVQGHLIPDTAKATWSFDHTAEKALIIIDGKEKTYAEMKALDPNTIKSVSVLKDVSATSLYGKKGENGVIIIELKK